MGPIIVRIVFLKYSRTAMIISKRKLMSMNVDLDGNHVNGNHNNNVNNGAGDGSDNCDVDCFKDEDSILR